MKFLNSQGFTLIETIVVIAVAGIIGVILTDTITQVYRSQNKSNSLNQIKQNGQTALDYIDKTIRNADRVICLSNSQFTVSPFNIPSVVVIAKQGNFTRFMFRIPKDNTIKENGHIAVDYPNTNMNNNDPDYCTGLVAVTEPNVVKLTNSDQQTGISVLSGSFTKTSTPGFKDVITIQFTASTGPSGLAETQSGVQFKTAVELR